MHGGGPCPPLQRWAVTVEDDDGNSHLLGADDHLTKPIEHARLTAWLERIAARAAGRRARLKLLLVEDNAMNVELFTAALETDGHDVVVERDGRGGLERALRERFDLLILDIQLPGMDGIALVRELRAADVRGPIIAVSSSAMQDQIDRGLAAGFDAYLTKPISPADLRSAVGRFTAGR